jgi:glycosyltransferase involved in cell wall biosynthesis
MEILFLYPKSVGLVPFIRKDVEILASKFQVHLFPFDRFRKDFYKLFKAVTQCDLVFNWFCGLHALTSNTFAKILRKNSVTIVGGYEVAYIKDYNYGQFVNGQNSNITIWGLKLSDLVINISKYSQEETIVNAKIPFSKVKMIYHGFSEEYFTRDPEIKKKNLVITIAKIDKISLIRKGLDIFVKSAHFLPEVDFMLVGPDLDGSVERLKNISPPNVSFTGGICGNALAKICNQAKVYVQASFHEGFGCSIAEAMLCGCIPVISNNTALPEVVGNTGIYIETRSPEDLANNIKKALLTSNRKEEDVINRIRTKFPISLRRRLILESIEKLKSKNL